MATSCTQPTPGDAPLATVLPVARQFSRFAQVPYTAGLRNGSDPVAFGRGIWQ
jgi:hypothetical protein